MMNDEGQDSKTVYSFARIDFCSIDISFALIEVKHKNFLNSKLSQVCYPPYPLFTLYTIMCKLQ